MDGINIINKDEIHVLYDENLSIENKKEEDNITITYSSNFNKTIGSSGFYFKISELYLQKNKFRVEFDARLINLDSEKKIKIYTGSKYIILDGNLTKKWNSFSLIEEFDFKSLSKYRINLVNPDNNLKYEIKNFAIYIEQIL